MTTVIHGQGPAQPTSTLRRRPPRPPKWVRVGIGSASDGEAVLAMLSRCSRMTLFRRFHGFINSVAYARALLALDRADTMTAIARCGSECVGVANLVNDGAGLFHLGVFVEDQWQRRGVGTQLIKALVDRARTRGLTTIHADVLAEHGFILNALRRLGPLSTVMEAGTIAVDIGLADVVSGVLAS